MNPLTAPLEYETCTGPTDSSCQKRDECCVSRNITIGNANTIVLEDLCVSRYDSGEWSTTFATGYNITYEAECDNPETEVETPKNHIHSFSFSFNVSIINLMLALLAILELL